MWSQSRTSCLSPLFRYFDFDVEPNQAYRYRVRIKLENPHDGEAAEKVADPRVAEGAVRLTPWSAPTPTARVPADAETYLVGITPAEGRKETRAQIDLYQWLPQTGTTAHKILEIERGRIIGQPNPPRRWPKPR